MLEQSIEVTSFLYGGLPRCDISRSVSCDARCELCAPLALYWEGRAPSRLLYKLTDREISERDRPPYRKEGCNPRQRPSLRLILLPSSRSTSKDIMIHERCIKMRIPQNSAVPGDDLALLVSGFSPFSGISNHCCSQDKINASILLILDPSDYVKGVHRRGP